MHPTSQLILGSSSPYRRELLQRLRIPFEVCAANIDEASKPHETPQQTALRLSEEKALALAPVFTNALIIGSDQVASFDGHKIGKPGTHEAALKQLQLFRGHSVHFYTGVCLLDTRDEKLVSHKQLVTTTVKFRHLDDNSLDAYLRIEQPYDCAGSAKNEGLGITLIERIDGSDPTALTGLPLIALTSMLIEAGIQLYH